jgi:hypothetical protein
MVVRMCNADYKGTAREHISEGLRMAFHYINELGNVGRAQIFWDFGLLFSSCLENYETYGNSTDIPRLTQFKFMQFQTYAF